MLQTPHTPSYLPLFSSYVALIRIPPSASVVRYGTSSLSPSCYSQLFKESTIHAAQTSSFLLTCPQIPSVSEILVLSKFPFFACEAWLAISKTLIPIASTFTAHSLHLFITSKLALSKCPTFLSQQAFSSVLLASRRFALGFWLVATRTWSGCHFQKIITRFEWNKLDAFWILWQIMAFTKRYETFCQYSSHFKSCSLSNDPLLQIYTEKPAHVFYLLSLSFFFFLFS